MSTVSTVYTVNQRMESLPIIFSFWCCKVKHHIAVSSVETFCVNLSDSGFIQYSMFIYRLHISSIRNGEHSDSK